MALMLAIILLFVQISISEIEKNNNDETFKAKYKLLHDEIEKAGCSKNNTWRCIKEILSEKAKYELNLLEYSVFFNSYTFQFYYL